METVNEDDRAASHGPSRGRRLLVIGLAVLVVVLVVAIALSRRDGSPSVTDEGGVVTTTDGETRRAIAERDGLILTGVQLTDVDGGIDPATGLPTSERSSFETGEGARLWVQFTYEGSSTRDSVVVIWYRDSEEVFRSSWRLPQTVENHNVALGAADTAESGNYRVEVTLNGTEVLHTVNFRVS